MLRTHTCGELRLSDAHKRVELSGWVQGVRDKGKMLWIDLRDGHGMTQLALEGGKIPDALIATARGLGREWVVRVCGEVVPRSAPNQHIPTGSVEVIPSVLEVVSRSKVPPFLIASETDGREALRMRYRYLDLRRSVMQENLRFRSEVQRAIRAYLHENGFTELETPLLVCSTPEGARDFLVPSRQHPGSSYALPQSPQIFKQLLMVGGLDRYYQFARCFRDEDLRSDRQPEFTQLDCELSFVTQEDVIGLFEGLISKVFEVVMGANLPKFPRLSYAEAMRCYGSDKPDLRWKMPIVDLSALVPTVEGALLSEVPVVSGLCIKGYAGMSRRKVEVLQKWLKADYPGLKGIFTIKYLGGIQSSLTKWYSPEVLEGWGKALGAQEGDMLLVVGGEVHEVLTGLGMLRLQVAKEWDIAPELTFAPVWVTDFPLLEWSKEEQRYTACHHPFTAPTLDTVALLPKDPAKVRAQAYDMVLNGVEIGGGSIRIHDPALQEAVFEKLGISPMAAKELFGFLLEALSYGAPPHGGIAIGLDRLCMVLRGGSSIRDYIPFPKNNAGRDVMSGAPK